jgi:hypothetical protein
VNKIKQGMSIKSNCPGGSISDGLFRKDISVNTVTQKPEKMSQCLPLKYLGEESIFQIIGTASLKARLPMG